MFKRIVFAILIFAFGCSKPKYLQGLPPIKDPLHFGSLFGQLEDDGCVYSGTDRVLECPQEHCSKCPKKNN